MWPRTLRVRVVTRPAEVVDEIELCGDGKPGYFRHELQLDCRVVCLADSRGMVAHPEGFSRKELNSLILGKEKTGIVTEKENLGLLNTEVFSLPFDRGVFCDLTATESTQTILQALSNGFHVVLANKKPLAGPQSGYDLIFKTAQEKNVLVRYEATVGAGLPVLDTLTKLHSAGDTVIRIEGCLSGTLGFLTSKLQEGISFAEAIQQVRENEGVSSAINYPRFF